MELTKIKPEIEHSFRNVKVKTHITKIAGNDYVGFTIGNQTFHLLPMTEDTEEETKEINAWMLDQLALAFGTIDGKIKSLEQDIFDLWVVIDSLQNKKK